MKGFTKAEKGSGIGSPIIPSKDKYREIQLTPETSNLQAK